jgi:hypothetical protein
MAELTFTLSLSCVHAKSADQLKSFVSNAQAISALISDGSLSIDHPQLFIFDDYKASPMAFGISLPTHPMESFVFNESAVSASKSGVWFSR